MKTKIYFDGGTTGANPGPMITGFVIQRDHLWDYVRADYPDVATNNEAEYCSVIEGLNYALEFGFREVELVGDSNLVVQQCSGKWKCNAVNLKPLLNEVLRLKKEFRSVKFTWVKRDLNLAGIFLEHGKEKAEIKATGF